MDDDVEVALIYRYDGMTEQPVIRPCNNHDPCMKWNVYKWNSTEVTSTVKSSSYIQIIGQKIQNPEDAMSTYALL